MPFGGIHTERGSGVLTSDDGNVEVGIQCSIGEDLLSPLLNRNTHLVELPVEFINLRLLPSDVLADVVENLGKGCLGSCGVNRRPGLIRNHDGALTRRHCRARRVMLDRDAFRSNNWGSPV